MLLLLLLLLMVQQRLPTARSQHVPTCIARQVDKHLPCACAKHCCCCCCT
jgi:hypothetical protein